MRESTGQPATNRPALSTSGGRKEKTAIDKIQQLRERNMQLLVDGGGRDCYSPWATNTNGAPNVNRTVTSLKLRFRAEPCQKQVFAAKGSPRTPLPKFTTLSLSNSVSVSIQHLAVLDMKRVMTRFEIKNLLTVVLPNKQNVSWYICQISL